MSVQIPRGNMDETLEALVRVLERYQADHPQSQIHAYRHNAVSVRVRIVDPQFTKLGRFERYNLVWKYLGELPEEIQGDLSSVLLLAPNERLASPANHEFEAPTPF